MDLPGFKLATRVGPPRHAAQEPFFRQLPLRNAASSHVVCGAWQALGSLSRDERRLFHDRMRQVDRRVMPGINKLVWTRPKPALDAYTREALWCGPAPSSSTAPFSMVEQGAARATGVLGGGVVGGLCRSGLQSPEGLPPAWPPLPAAFCIRCCVRAGVGASVRVCVSVFCVYGAIHACISACACSG